ncbi:MAG: hypothetical protein LBI44_04695 [Oscillospiraceae bacterium]|jgi:hypothetical protein|nr:hypothetical protein [Oscillospiraceae bacterium]
MKNGTANRRLIISGALIAVVSSAFWIAGQIKFSAADGELRAYYDSLKGGNPVTNHMAESAYKSERSMYYLPGEQMRGYAGYGVVFGVALAIWGVCLTRLRKKEGDPKAQVVDLLDEHNRGGMP